MTPEQMTALRREFPPECIGKLPKGGVMLDFVGHAHVTDRLLEVDPEWNWEPVARHPETGEPLLSNGGKGLWIRLTVGGITRLGYGDVENNKAGNVKELISDALRNAGMRFGIALELWAKTDLESSAGKGTKRTRKPAAAAHSTTRRPPPAAAAPATNGGGPTCADCQRPIGTDAATKRAGRIVHVSCSPVSADLPAADAGGSPGRAPAAGDHDGVSAGGGPTTSGALSMTSAQRGKLLATLAEHGKGERQARLDWASDTLGRFVESFSSLTKAEAHELIEAATKLPVPA